MTDPDLYEDDGSTIYVSMSAEATVIAGPHDDGLSSARVPVESPDSPPSDAGAAQSSGTPNRSGTDCVP